jgi:putative ABC transport system permease protein
VLSEEIPEVAAAARLLAYFEASLPGRAAVSRGENSFSERFFWADPSFLEIFSHPMVAGDPANALRDPHTVVLTEAAAFKYFGDTAPLDQILKIDSGYSEADYRVVGVMADVPENCVICAISSSDSTRSGWWSCRSATSR